MSHSNISIFIPHLGCPCKCSFCNQRYITGKTTMPTENDIDIAVNEALKSKKFDKATGQLAFFGGSFTAINKDLMLKYLKIGKKHIDNGNVESIRISTRPDAIDDVILHILKDFGVKSIELGAQSMVDNVLLANNRGHSSKDVVKAAKLIKEFGFELGLQMMTGLYKSDDEKELFTANEFVKLNPDTVRIYPTIVIKNTDLQKKYESGEYKPQTVENAVKLGSKLLSIFMKNNIVVIRFGLHSIDKDSYVAGPWHPAIRELVQSEVYFKLICDNLNEKGFYTVFVNEKEISKAIGQKKTNIIKLRDLGYFIDVKPSNDIKKYEVKIMKG